MDQYIIIDKYVISNNNNKINIIPIKNYIFKRIDVSNYPIKTLGNDIKDISLIKLIKSGKINFNEILDYYE